MERPRQQFEHITKDNLSPASKHLSHLIWQGKYDEALPLSDKIFEFRSLTDTDRKSALVERASNYYSAASRLWKDKGIGSAIKIKQYMTVALECLEECINLELEAEKGVRSRMIPVRLNHMSSSELDVMQAIYARASDMMDHIPLVRPFRQRHLDKKSDWVRDFDTAALLAIRAGLKKSGAPHTRIFLLAGAYAIASKYKKAGAHTYARRMFELADSYPWPHAKPNPDYVREHQSEYGQAARVARHLRDVARARKSSRIALYSSYTEVYSALIPDQKVKA